MNSIIAIALGILIGGVATSYYYGRKYNSIMAAYLDTKTVNKLLKEHTSKVDEKKSTKKSTNKRTTKKRRPQNTKSAKKS
tara:strand:- start:454 stop:693 length:240 start_codon:yes stop_codon:yes gene_type:complete